MKIAFFYALFFLLNKTASMAQGKVDCIKLSQELLYAVKTGEASGLTQTELATLSAVELQKQLDSDAKRKSFWLNIYNAYTQLQLKADPGSYKNRGKFFKNRFIRIAGNNISLDLIEHGILRRSKAKLSLGYFNKLFKSGVEKKFRVEQLDYRIHFGLNCGAKSCPPIAFYKPEQIDKQLDLVTKIYLKNEVLFNGKDLTVEVPAILSWFRGDFGGKKGILRLLRQLQLIPENASPGIHWKKYDWTIALNVYE